PEPEVIKTTDPASTSKKDDEKEEEKQKVENSKTEKDVNEKNIEVKPPSIPPKPEQYILHRDFFYLRESGLRRKRQEKEAHNVLRQLPSVPKTSLNNTNN
ncbi:2753_t:CDS:1, partial [Acaulospora colombiana]